MSGKKKKKGTEDKGVVPTSRLGTEVIRIIRGVKQRYFFVSIRGNTPLVMDRKSERIIDEIRRRQLKMKEQLEVKIPPTPENLFYEAMWQVKNGRVNQKHEITTPFCYPGEPEPRTFSIDINPAFCTIGMKKSLFSAGRGLEGVEMTKIKTLVHVQGQVFPIDYESVEMEEFLTTNMRKNVILKWLPVFHGWTATPLFSIIHPAVSPESLVNLINAAGALGGLGVRRPELGGIFGNYEVDEEKGIKEVGFTEALAYNYENQPLRERIEYVPKEEGNGKEKGSDKKKANAKEKAGKKPKGKGTGVGSKKRSSV